MATDTQKLAAVLASAQQRMVRYSRRIFFWKILQAISIGVFFLSSLFLVIFPEIKFLRVILCFIFMLASMFGAIVIGEIKDRWIETASKLYNTIHSTENKLNQAANHPEERT